jgi:glycosyltransferase involved in cell wall biosynthesis
MMRLFIFESHPVQYHAPVYRELHRLCVERGRGQVLVFYGTDVTTRGHFDAGFGKAFAWDEPLLQGYSARVLKTENGVPLEGFNSLTGKRIPALLRRERPDAVLLTNLAYRFDWTVYLTALRLGIPIWLRAETQDEAFERSRLKSLLRYWFYRLVYVPVRKALVIGKLNAAHYERHGVPARRHARSPYCVVDRFANISEAQASACRRKIRSEAGFSEDQTVLLFCGKLQPKKYPEALLEALEAMPFEERRRYGVLYVGTGELERAVRLRARSLPGTKVWFAGFRNQTELPPFYLAADVLVLPSRKMGETWGLVVNEALLAGLKVIISRNVGCHADFQEAPGVLVFDGSVGELKTSLRRLPQVASGQGPREFMCQYSVRAAAEGIARAMGFDPTRLAGQVLADSHRRIAPPQETEEMISTKEVAAS